MAWRRTTRSSLRWIFMTPGSSREGSVILSSPAVVYSMPLRSLAVWYWYLASPKALDTAKPTTMPMTGPMPKVTAALDTPAAMMAAAARVLPTPTPTLTTVVTTFSLKSVVNR